MNIFKYVLPAVVSCLFMLPAYSWTVTRDFEGVTNNAVLPYALGDNANQFKPDNDSSLVYGNSTFGTSGFPPNAVSGSKTIRIRHNPSAPQSWDSAFSVDADQRFLTEGEEFWASVWMFFPYGFNWGSNDRPKILRVYAANHTDSFVVNLGSASGNTSLYLIKRLMSAKDMYYSDVGIYKTNPGLYADDSINSAQIPVNQWVNYEMYGKMSTNSSVGKFRVWMNGKLLFDRTGVTLGGGGQAEQHIGKGPIFILFSNWENPASPKVQDSFADKIVFTTDPSVASKIDAAGNRMIGLGSSTVVPSPTPKVKCACSSTPNASNCAKISGTARQYTCSGTCPTGCNRK